MIIIICPSCKSTNIITSYGEFDCLDCLKVFKSNEAKFKTIIEFSNGSSIETIPTKNIIRAKRGEIDREIQKKWFDEVED